MPVIPFAVLAVRAFNQISGRPTPAQFVYGKIGTPTGGTLTERQVMWAQSLTFLRQSPAPGLRLGAYSRIAPYAPPSSRAQPSLVQPHTHNLFLQVGLDTGVIGLPALAGLLVLAALSAGPAYRAAVERDLAIALLAALTFGLVHCLGDVVVWRTAKPSLLWWLILATCLGLDKFVKAR